MLKSEQEKLSPRIDHMFEHFLSDAREYDRAAGLWRVIMTQLSSKAPLAWVPWLSTVFADGTEMRDGNPIISLIRVDQARAIVVIQEEGPQHIFEAWMDTFGDDTTVLKLRLVANRETVMLAAGIARLWFLDIDRTVVLQAAQGLSDAHSIVQGVL